jgi:hypothetical protein
VTRDELLDNVRVVASSYAASDIDRMILADATAASLTVTLPTAVGRSGKGFRVKRISTNSNTVTVATTSSQTIDGDSTLDLAALTAVELVSDGANWRVF